MDLEQDDWIDNQGSNDMDIEGNQQTCNIYIDAFTQSDFPHHLCLYHHRARRGARLVQEGGDVLLRPGAEKGPEAE